jgi:hypothetical protein
MPTINTTMKTAIQLMTLSILGVQISSAHTNYGTATRNLGPGTTAGTVADPITGFSITPYFKSISISNIATDSGWAAGTSPELGDAHHIRAFRFTLAEAGLATLRAQSGTSGFFPGFSLYSGLLNLTGGSPYDGAALTVDYLENVLGQDTSEGYRALNSLGKVIMFNDAGNKSEIDHVGNAADGTSANFGNAAGIWGDGMLDGVVERSFWLEAGDYTVFLGGANIHGTESANQGASLSLSVIPEPSGVMLIGLSVACFVFRRRVG